MTVIWIILEILFLFLFFELPPVDDTVKSKYEEYLENKHRQQQIQNSSSDKRNEVDKKDVNTVKEESADSDPSQSASVQEKMPLLSNDSMQDVPAADDRNVTLPPQNFCQRAYWLLNG